MTHDTKNKDESKMDVHEERDEQNMDAKKDERTLEDKKSMEKEKETIAK